MTIDNSLRESSCKPWILLTTDTPAVGRLSNGWKHYKVHAGWYWILKATSRIVSLQIFWWRTHSAMKSLSQFCDTERKGKIQSPRNHYAKIGPSGSTQHALFWKKLECGWTTWLLLMHQPGFYHDPLVYIVSLQQATNDQKAVNAVFKVEQEEKESRK